MLNLHVAGLAKADEVAARIRRFDGGEGAERNDVVHWHGRANVLSAMVAVPILLRDNRCPSLKPALASVGGDAANIVRRIRSRLMQRLIGAVAPFGAKSQPALRFVLPGKPRLEFELLPTMRAIVKLTDHSVHFTRGLWGECVRRAKAAPPFVPDLVLVRHGSDAHMPCATAPLATKSRPILSVWLDQKLRAAIPSKATTARRWSIFATPTGSSPALSSLTSEGGSNGRKARMRSISSVGSFRRARITSLYFKMIGKGE